MYGPQMEIKNESAAQVPEQNQEHQDSAQVKSDEQIKFPILPGTD